MPHEKKKGATEWVDPLYKVFEHFLFTRTYEDSTAFTREVATQYLAYLDSTEGFIPCHARKALQEELEAEVHEMLVKKIYGFGDMPNEPNVPMPKLVAPPTSDGGDDHF